MKSKLIIVGGFLGAGKTSLLWEIAKLIEQKGEKVGLITNDQASELVDTSFLETSADLVKEVSGSCFCCNFNGFADAIRYIGDKNCGGIIIAEPVGSCTDLSATLMQPLKDKYSDSIDLAPLTVLADPFILKDILDDSSSTEAYIIRKQFEETDIILINKTDLLSGAELADLKARAAGRWPDTGVLSVSVKNGEGLNEWLKIVMSSKKSGEKIAEVDYDIYAAGEAAFGWLNASFSIEKGEGDLCKAASDFLNALGNRFDEINATVGHIKFLLQSKEQMIVGNITGKSKAGTLRKMEGRERPAILTVNARVEISPEELEKIILAEVDKHFKAFNYKKLTLNCLMPGRPNPTYRYNTVKSCDL